MLPSPVTVGRDISSERFVNRQLDAVSSIAAKLSNQNQPTNEIFGTHVLLEKRVKRQREEKTHGAKVVFPGGLLVEVQGSGCIE